MSSSKLQKEEENIEIVIDRNQSQIKARRSESGSLAKILRNEDGSISLVHHASSACDINAAARRRNSGALQPHISQVFGFQVGLEEDISKPPKADELINTEGEFCEHLWPLDALAERYHTHINVTGDITASRGLTEIQAKETLLKIGPNVLTPPPKIPSWLLFLMQFTNLLMILLMITGTVCLILYGVDKSAVTNLYVGVLLWFAVIVTCIETWKQEAKSDELMEKFRVLLPEHANVIRNGVKIKIASTDIVPGELIQLSFGDKIPADCRVIFCQNMKVDQSTLTGESEPVDISEESHSQIPQDSKNLIFNGSLVLDGTCLAVAIRTGDGTVVGKMVHLTGVVGKSSSTLQVDIVHFVRIITIFAFVQAIVVVVVGILRGINPIQVFLQGFVTIMLGNVPQVIVHDSSLFLQMK